MRKFFAKKPAPRARQPLTVQRPSQAFSYYAGDQPHVKDSVRARQASEHRVSFFKKLRLVPSLIAISAILLSIVYSTTLSTTPIVRYIGDASPYRTRTEYTKGIEDLLSTSFSNRSKLTMNASSAARVIQKRYPEIDVATVSLPIIGRRPTILLHAHTPALVLTTATNAYVVDKSGVVVGETKQVSSSLLTTLLSVQDQSGIKLAVGDQAITANTINFITNLNAQLTAKQQTLTSLILIAGGYEIDARIKDVSYFFKLDSSGDARLQVGAYLAARESGAQPTEYMDIRVEEKVFYK